MEITASGYAIDEANRFLIEISSELGDMAGKGAILNELRTHLFDMANDIARNEGVDIDTAVFISIELMGSPKKIARRFREIEEEEPAGFVTLDQNSVILLLVLGVACIAFIAFFSALNPSLGIYGLIVGGLALAGYILILIFLYLRTNQQVDEEIRSIGNTIAQNLNIIASDIAKFGRDLMGHIERKTPREERQVFFQKQYRIDRAPPEPEVPTVTKPRKPAYGEHLGGILGAIILTVFLVITVLLIWIRCPFFVAEKINLFVLGAIFVPIVLDICVNIVKGMVGRIRTTQGLETLANGISTICLGYLLIVFPFDFVAGIEWFINVVSPIQINIPFSLYQGNFFFALVLTVILVINLVETLVGAIKFYTFKKADILSLWASST
ncbi:MAG: hypothetical protein ACFFBD_30525 [Candidatus Hodarchaeota archaeon]